MYRERHTNNCSIMAKTVDQQNELILTSVDFLPEWRDQMARLAVTHSGSPDPKKLREQRRRVSRAYAEGAFSDTEYEAILDELDMNLRSTEDVGHKHSKKQQDYSRYTAGLGGSDD